MRHPSGGSGEGGSGTRGSTSGAAACGTPPRLLCGARICGCVDEWQPLWDGGGSAGARPVSSIPTGAHAQGPAPAAPSSCPHPAPPRLAPLAPRGFHLWWRQKLPTGNGARQRSHAAVGDAGWHTNSAWTATAPGSTDALVVLQLLPGLRPRATALLPCAEQVRVFGRPQHAQRRGRCGSVRRSGA